MTRTAAQEAVLRHLRTAYVGPHDEHEVVFNRPDFQYTVGMLFPIGSETSESATTDADHEHGVGEAVGETDAAAGVPLAEDWRPSSMALSFVTDSSMVSCDFSGGVYRRIPGDGPPRWQRHPFEFRDVTIACGNPPHQLDAAGVPIEIGARWRQIGDGNLVTVHVRVRARSTGAERDDVERTVYQVSLEVEPSADGRILEYTKARPPERDPESTELHFRYRESRTYAVGHGMAAGWDAAAHGCSRVRLEPVPAWVVPDVEVRGFAAGSTEAEALRLDLLSQVDTRTAEVVAALTTFVRSYSDWVGTQRHRCDDFGSSASVARSIVARAQVSVERMEAGVALLAEPDQDALRTAFALAMAAMRLQMRQIQIRRQPDTATHDEPQWRPFQLGFLLVALASTVDDVHTDRELVDLIWFPTGGGKTEAYLALAAVEIFRRRLQYGAEGSGTAVITRYTLRLLTAQQFQRAAGLVCAMELLRHDDRRAHGLAPFTIGLWVGNQASPGTREEARVALDRLRKAARPDEANQFQIEGCPWCGARLLPRSGPAADDRYGFRISGRDVVVHCTEPNCPFHEELPVGVVDEVLYATPPTILLATVDKFARLQFKPEAGRLLGLGTPFRQPSMIIQDELHLLAGPLGTTVAVFDAVIQTLLGRQGPAPKIVASTATIRASGEQIRGLYGRPVALYPPTGLDGDRTFFSNPVGSGEGRLYVGLMPQSLSQASAMVAAATPMIEIPEVLDADRNVDAARDAYWTAVMYHNSLRELGRTGTLVVDDVNGRLEPRADRLGLPLRRVRADHVLELTSRRGPEELTGDLRQLERSVNDGGEDATDVVLSSSMLSVGIDVPRLALMLMVGQPKTTAEYIQATSRVGRGATKGIVTTLFRSNRARDRSHFETFRQYHETLYRNVEPTSVTPWSLASRERSLAGALVILVRHCLPTLRDNDSAVHLDLKDDRMRATLERLIAVFVDRVDRADRVESEETTEQLWRLMREWDRRASTARDEGAALPYENRKVSGDALLKRFYEPRDGWPVADSMRSVESGVAVQVREPMEEVRGGSDHS